MFDRGTFLKNLYDFYRVFCQTLSNFEFLLKNPKFIPDKISYSKSSNSLKPKNRSPRDCATQTPNNLHAPRQSTTNNAICTL